MLDLRTSSLALFLAGCQLISGVDDLVVRTGGGAPVGGGGPGAGGAGAGEGGGGGVTNAGGSAGGVPCANNTGTLCGDECITDLPSNPAHCGACGVTCEPSESCASGHCVLKVDYAGYSSPKALVATGSEVFFTAHAPSSLSGKDAVVKADLAGAGELVVLDNLDQASTLIGALEGAVVAEAGGTGRVQYCSGAGCAAVFNASPQLRLAALDPVMGQSFYYVRADRIAGVHGVLAGAANLYSNTSPTSLANTFTSIDGVVLTEDVTLETSPDDKPDALAVIGAGQFGFCKLAHTASQVQCDYVSPLGQATSLVYRSRRTGPEASVLVATVADGAIWSVPVAPGIMTQQLASGLNGVKLLGLDSSGAYTDDELFWVNATELRGCSIGAGICQAEDFSTELVAPVALAITPAHLYVLSGDAASASLTRIRR